MRVVHLNFADKGGAATVAKELNKFQLRANIISGLYFLMKGNYLNFALKHPFKSLGMVLDFYIVRHDNKSPLFTVFRFGKFKKSLFTSIDKNVIVHFHWTPGIVSRKEFDIATTLSNKKVWTLHDMWPITGGCHHALECVNYKSSCSECPQVKRIYRNSVERQFRFKKRFFEKNPDLVVVAPSKWLYDQAKESSILRKSKIVLINNPVNTHFFTPSNKIESRKKMGLETSGIYFGFSAINLDDPMKGVQTLTHALEELSKSKTLPKFKCLVIGNGNTQNLNKELFVPFSFTNSQQILKDFYNSCDIFLNFSKAENFPNNILEAQSCGIPVICNNVGGNNEIIKNFKNGFVLENLTEFNDFVQIILNTKNYSDFSRISRNSSVARFNPEFISNSYLKLYNNL